MHALDTSSTSLEIEPRLSQRMRLRHSRKIKVRCMQLEVSVPQIKSQSRPGWQKG